MAKKINNKFVDHAIDLLSQSTKLKQEDFLKLYSPIQKKWITNWSDHFQMFFGGRRAGKTVGNIGKILFCDLYYNTKKTSNIFIVCATKETAKDLYWEKLLKANSTLGLDYIPNEASLRIKTPRNTIMFLGMNDWRSVKRKLGVAIKLALIDEAQNVPNHLIKEFVDDVASWSTIDHKGIVCLSGNPPALHRGFVYEHWVGYKEKEVFRLSCTIYDNPELKKDIKRIERIFASERKRRGLIEGQEDAAYRRLVKGEWVEDLNRIIFKPNEKNFFEKIPSGSYSKVMGLDFGYKDKDAISVLTFDPKSKNIYLEHEWEASGLNLEQISFKVKQIADHFGCHFVTYDPGGMGKKIGETLSGRFSTINFVAADTKEKMQWIELLKTEIEGGRFFMKKDGVFHRECPHIFYSEESNSKLDERNGIHSDILPAIIYALKEVYSRLEVQDIEEEEDEKIDMIEYLDELHKTETQIGYISHLDLENIREKDLKF